MEQLLRRRDWTVDGTPALQHAVTLAQEGRIYVLGDLINEALRFHPVFPVLQRYAQRDTVIAAGLEREFRVKGGTNVVVSLLSGMFDDTTVERSESFRAQRDDADYLHFGSGQHFCLGADIAREHLIEMVSAVLRLPGFENASYIPADYDGPAIHHLYV